MAKKQTQKYEEMLPEDFYRELNRAPIIYFTCGGLEAHGPHNALGMDGLHAYRICLEAAKISGGIVFPPTFISVPYWPGLKWEELKKGDKELYPPSVFHSVEFLEKFYEETLWNFERLGFKVCIAAPGHAPNINLMFDFCKKINYRYGKMIVHPVVMYSREYLEDYKTEELCHGGVWESSTLKAFYPKLVKPSKIKKFLSGERGDIPAEAKLQWTPANLKNPGAIKWEKAIPYIKLISRTIANKAIELLKE